MGDVTDSVCDQECAICLETWTEKGKHRAFSLECGHTFGFACISRWVKTAGNCPVCKHEAEPIVQNWQIGRGVRQTQVQRDAARLERNRIARDRRRAARERQAMGNRRLRDDNADMLMDYPGLMFGDAF